MNAAQILSSLQNYLFEWLHGDLILGSRVRKNPVKTEEAKFRAMAP